MSVGQMDDSEHGGIHILDGVVSTVDELCEILVTLCAVGATRFPKHTTLGFIAYLHPFRNDAEFLERVEDIVSVLIDFLAEPFHTVVGP